MPHLIFLFVAYNIYIYIARVLRYSYKVFLITVTLESSKSGYRELIHLINYSFIILSFQDHDSIINNNNNNNNNNIIIITTTAITTINCHYNH
jgi:hypothetical protein